MKLKIFVPKKNGHTTQDPFVKFHPKSGVIRINRAAAKILGLTEKKEGVVFAQDEERPRDWYIRKQDKGVGNAINVCGRDGAYTGSNMSLCSMISTTTATKNTATLSPGIELKLSAQPTESDYGFTFHALIIIIQRETYEIGKPPKLPNIPVYEAR